MNALAKAKQEVATTGSGGQPPSDATSLMAVISRAASDPNTDVDKLERLMGMYERITTARNKASFDAALATMQPELPVVDRRGKIVIRDKNDKEIIIQSTPYALFEDICKAVGPKLAEHGFAISFRTGTAADGKLLVTAILSHRDGHREETSMPLMHDSTGSKNAVQAVGSSVSYGKRYTMCALLNIVSHGEDDDGKSAGAGETITDEQVQEISNLLTETKSNLVLFLKKIKVESLTEIRADKLGDIKTLIKDTAAKRAALAKKEPAQ